jgi:hypothetical protein
MQIAFVLAAMLTASIAAMAVGKTILSAFARKDFHAPRAVRPRAGSGRRRHGAGPFRHGLGADGRLKRRSAMQRRE